MTWRDQLVSGDFRGVPFQVDRHDREGGRRLAVHQYPGRDVPYTEDLGRRGGRYQLELYVLGPEYFAGRDALLSALEESGSGPLTHPYLGVLEVHAESFRLRETTREGGVARFSVTFVEASEQPAPRIAVSTQGVVDTAADVAAEQAQADFEEAFEVVQKPAWVAEAAAGVLGTVATKLDELRGRIPTVPAQAYTFVAAIGRVTTTAADLVRTPANLAAEVAGLVADVGALVVQPFDALTTLDLLGLFGSTLADVLGTTAHRSLQRSNQNALVGLVRDLAAVEGTRQASSIEWANATDALAARDAWADTLDDRLADAGDTLYGNLMDLRAALVTDLTRRGAQLPRVVTTTPGATVPALVVAHRLYGTAAIETRAAEITARNRHVRHPGFVPGGTALEVLSV